MRRRPTPRTDSTPEPEHLAAALATWRETLLSVKESVDEATAAVGLLRATVQEMAPLWRSLGELGNALGEIDWPEAMGAAASELEESPAEATGPRPQAPAEIAELRPRPQAPAEMAGPRPQVPEEATGPRPEAPAGIAGPQPQVPAEVAGLRPQAPVEIAGPQPQGPAEVAGLRPQAPVEIAGPQPQGPAVLEDAFEPAVRPDPGVAAVEPDTSGSPPPPEREAAAPDMGGSYACSVTVEEVGTRVKLAPLHRALGQIDGVRELSLRSYTNGVAVVSMDCDAELDASAIQEAIATITDKPCRVMSGDGASFLVRMSDSPAAGGQH